MSEVIDASHGPTTSAPSEKNVEEAIVKPKGGNYKGFVAGVFSGIAKLSVGVSAARGKS